jgi:hypothetical protein
MTIKPVDIGNLKKEIISMMDTGYDADKKVCIEVLNCIDRNILPAKEELELTQLLDDFKMTPERIKRSEETARALHTMTADDWFREFTI